MKIKHFHKFYMEIGAGWDYLAVGINKIKSNPIFLLKILKITIFTNTFNNLIKGLNRSNNL